MKLVVRSVVSTAVLAMLVALAPHATFAACSAGGTVSNIAQCVPEAIKDTDCKLEWSISPVPPINPKTGVPTNKIVCIDNDPTCDADTKVGQCTFNVGACVNVVDGRFACTPTDVSTYLLKKPGVKDAARPDKNPFARDNQRNIDSGLDAIVPTASTNVCADEKPFVVALKKGKKNTLQIQAVATDSASEADKDSIKFTCVPNPNAGTLPLTSARQITSSSELIGGPLAMGRIGDWLIENDRVRFVIRDVGRDFSFMLTYGGHIMDADFQRPSGQGRDNFLGMTPLINVSSTDNPTSITVVNSGATGGPAVLRTEGPDDLFDPIDPYVAIKGFSTTLSVPPFAVDNNLPLTIINEYTLKAGDPFLEIETIVQNDGAVDPVEIYVGDFTSAGGQHEVVAPGLGFGDAALRLGGIKDDNNNPVPFNWLGWLGFGESQGISYGLIPEVYNSTSAFSQSGVVVPVYGQSLLDLLNTNETGFCTLDTNGNPCVVNSGLCIVCEINTDCQPPHQAGARGNCENAKPAGALKVLPNGGMNSFRRWFAISDNGMGGIVDARNALAARGDIVDPSKTGWVHGTVSVGGVGVDGARVTVSVSPGDRQSGNGLIDVFETKDGGYFQGTLPKGEYRAFVKIPGYPYQNNGVAPVAKSFKVSSSTQLDFDVPPTGFLRVDVTNGVTTNPIPAKVSVVGVTQAVDPGNTETILLNILEVSGNLFGYDAREKVAIHGLPAVQFADVSGSTPVFPLQPGDYQIVVSHGPEYSVSKTNLTVVAGTASTPQIVTASVVPVVDTTGFVSADHHVHLIHSPDSTVSEKERIVTMLAEGVDYFVASDHDFKTDVTADIAALGASSMLKAAVSNEITYFDNGHFGAYPMDTVPGSVTGGAIDWGRAGVAPGLGYPSVGGYDLSVNEMALVAKAPPNNATVVQANHFNSTSLGFFRLSGIDTTVAPPQSSTPPANLRLNPAITNLYSDEITALELWIESSRDQNALALGENLGDFFNMLNNFDSTHPLLRKGIVCDSDTHTRTIIQAGGPRNMLASATDDPALLVPQDLANSVNEGRNVCTSGPFVRVSVVGDGGAVASHDLADPLIVPATLGTATLHVDIQSPTWAEYDRIEVYINNVPSCVNTPVTFLGGSKKNCTATPNFVLTPTVSTVPVNGDFRLQSATLQNLSITQDSWVMVVVRGTDNVSKPLFPMNPQSILPRACSLNPCRQCGQGAEQVACGPFGTCPAQTNMTLAQLTDGNLNQCGVLSLAIANPLYIDFTGDGLYKGVAIP